MHTYLSSLFPTLLHHSSSIIPCPLLITHVNTLALCTTNTIHFCHLLFSTTHLLIWRLEGGREGRGRTHTSFLPTHIHSLFLSYPHIRSITLFAGSPPSHTASYTIPHSVSPPFLQSFH